MKELIENTIADGVVDADEVQILRKAIYADGKVDEDEVLAVFEINDAVSGNDNHSSWKDLVVEVVCDFALKDDVSPGVVDADEGKFLADLIMNDDEVDVVETAVLVALKEKATAIESVELNELLATL